MTDVVPFALLVAVVSVAGLLAVWSNRLSERIRVPAPAIFLVAAAVASRHSCPVSATCPIVTVQRIVTVMLILLLFDGGMHIGWRRFRPRPARSLWIGVAGTLVTAGAASPLLAHLVFGFDWRPALLLGAALAPDRPGRGLLGAGPPRDRRPLRHPARGRVRRQRPGRHRARWPPCSAPAGRRLARRRARGRGVRAADGASGLAVGVGRRATCSALLMRRVPLPNGALYPLRTLLGAGADLRRWPPPPTAPASWPCSSPGSSSATCARRTRREIERFHGSLASLGRDRRVRRARPDRPARGPERRHDWLIGLGLAVLLALVVRPLLVGAAAAGRSTCSRGERLFVLWSGLKGAVPILLGTYILTDGVPGRRPALRGRGRRGRLLGRRPGRAGADRGAPRSACRCASSSPSRGRWACGSGTSRPGCTATRSAPGTPADGCTLGRPRPRRGRLDQHDQPGRRAGAGARRHGRCGPATRCCCWSTPRPRPIPVACSPDLGWLGSPA